MLSFKNLFLQNQIPTSVTTSLCNVDISCIKSWSTGEGGTVGGGSREGEEFLQRDIQKHSKVVKMRIRLSKSWSRRIWWDLLEKYLEKDFFIQDVFVQVFCIWIYKGNFCSGERRCPWGSCFIYFTSCLTTHQYLHIMNIVM